MQAQHLFETLTAAGLVDYLLHTAANDPSEAERELLEEQTAIIRFDGGMERPQAEQLAKLHTEYLLHRWQCSTCCSSGLRRSKRCYFSLELWNAYELEAAR